jgi:hypothetical protein
MTARCVQPDRASAGYWLLTTCSAARHLHALQCGLGGQGQGCSLGAFDCQKMTGRRLSTQRHSDAVAHEKPHGRETNGRQEEDQALVGRAEARRRSSDQGWPASEVGSARCCGSDSRKIEGGLQLARLVAQSCRVALQPIVRPHDAPTPPQAHWFIGRQILFSHLIHLSRLLVNLLPTFSSHRWFFFAAAVDCGLFVRFHSCDGLIASRCLVETNSVSLAPPRLWRRRNGRA